MVDVEESETVFPIIASIDNPKFSQYIASKLDDFSYDSDIGLIYHEGTRDQADDRIRPYAEKFKKAVKARTTPEDAEVFSTEKLWDMDAFELGEIAKIDGQYYNLISLYKYFFMQFSMSDPYYYDDTRDSLLRTATTQINLPATRTPYTLNSLKHVMVSTDDWWGVQVPFKKFNIEFDRLTPAPRKRAPLPVAVDYIPSYNPNIYCDPETGLLTSASPRLGEYPDSDYTDYDGLDGSDGESVDSNSREIDYPDADTDDDEGDDPYDYWYERYADE